MYDWVKLYDFQFLYAMRFSIRRIKPFKKKNSLFNRLKVNSLLQVLQLWQKYLAHGVQRQALRGAPARVRAGAHR